MIGESDAQAPKKAITQHKIEFVIGNKISYDTLSSLWCVFQGAAHETIHGYLSLTDTVPHTRDNGFIPADTARGEEEERVAVIFPSDFAGWLKEMNTAGETPMTPMLKRPKVQGGAMRQGLGEMSWCILRLQG